MSARQLRLLLVSPVFHGYWRSIERAFTQLGYDVVTHLYDAATSGQKAVNKLRHELPARVLGRGTHMSVELATQRAVRALADVRPDRLLAIRGDVLGPPFWSAVADLDVPAVVWLYDELHRLHNDPVAMSDVVRLATYSPADIRALAARGVDAQFVPLAYDPVHELRDIPRRPEFSFVGARYPERERLLRGLVASGLPVRAYGRDWSGHPLDRLRTWRVAGAGVPAARDISLVDGYSVMRASLATLNVHGDQDGFTMRTFEACGVGGVQLVDRAAVADFYVPGEEVLVFESDDELVELARHILRHPAAWDHMREAARARTLSDHTFVHRARVLESLWS